MTRRTLLSAPAALPALLLPVEPVYPEGDAPMLGTGEQLWIAWEDRRVLSCIAEDPWREIKMTLAEMCDTPLTLIVNSAATRAELAEQVRRLLALIEDPRVPLVDQDPDRYPCTVVDIDVDEGGGVRHEFWR